MAQLEGDAPQKKDSVDSGDSVKSDSPENEWKSAEQAMYSASGSALIEKATMRQEVITCPECELTRIETCGIKRCPLCFQYNEVKTVRSQLEAARVQCAALRKAAEGALEHLEQQWACMEGGPAPVDNHSVNTVAMLEAALADPTGAVLLERLEKAEKYYDNQTNEKVKAIGLYGLEMIKVAKLESESAALQAEVNKAKEEASIWESRYNVCHTKRTRLKELQFKTLAAARSLYRAWRSAKRFHTDEYRNRIALEAEIEEMNAQRGRMIDRLSAEVERLRMTAKTGNSDLPCSCTSTPYKPCIKHSKGR